MSKSIENTTSYKLRMCRENCGLSQKVVAEALGVDRTTYTYYENGRSQPNLNTLVKLANIFCVDPATLLPCEKSSSTLKDTDKQSPNPIYSLKKDEQSLLLSFRMLDDNEKEKVLAIITNMLRSDV